MAKTAQELAKERLARIEAAINFEEPDRVPVWGFGGDIVPAYSGYTNYDMCYDEEKNFKGQRKVHEGLSL